MKAKDELAWYKGQGTPSILTLDPGESTGWSYLSRTNQLAAGTLPKDHGKVAEHILQLRPDVIVFETFNLYPGKAQSLSWNSFYPCEVIGIIKYLARWVLGTHIVEQAPAIKRYAGALPKQFLGLSRADHKLTEHSKDAVQHLCYYLRQMQAIDRLK